MRALLLAAVLVACESCRPNPPLPPPDAPGTCETAHEHLQALGGCGLDMATFVADCHDTETAERDIGKRLPLGCLSTAANCDVARRCR